MAGENAGRSCPAGHERPARSAQTRACPTCRRDQVLDQVTGVEPSLSRAQVGAALDMVVTSGAALRDLSSALAADPNALKTGAPPVVGRLVNELIACGSTTFLVPACSVCTRTGMPLTRSDVGGLCQRCRHRHLATACARCQVVKPVGGRDSDGRPVCARCADRPQRECGICGRIRRIGARARQGRPDICESCFRMPEATCSRCRRVRPCSFATTAEPICATCATRATARCAHCGADRPPTANWPEGPVCEPCYTAALRRRGVCAGCQQTRRLLQPPGPTATLCPDCADHPAVGPTHICGDCGVEDKMYERGRCASCALNRRTDELLRADADGQILPALAPIREAITASRSPRSALNWLYRGAGAAVLADLATGRLPLTHDGLDAHPQPRAADYLRHILVAARALPERDEDLARVHRWAADLLASIDNPTDRHLVHAFTTWAVLRRLRRRSERRTGPHTPTAGARNQIRAAVAFLAWLRQRGLNLATTGQGDVDDWLTTGPGAPDVRAFLTWATEHAHTGVLAVPVRARTAAPATDPEQRWEQLTRLLHDDTLEPSDRLAGSLLLLYGQQISRISIMTTDQITHRDGTTYVRFARDELPLPDPLTAVAQDLLQHGRTHHLGVGSPPSTDWLFPGHLPGRPINSSHLADRLRHLGIHAQPGRRSALTHLAAHLPAAVLADLLHIAPTTAVRWMRETGTDWNQYAAELITDHDQ